MNMSPSKTPLRRHRPSKSLRRLDRFELYLRELRHDRLIERHQLVLLDEKRGDLNGFVWLHGSSEQLSAVYSSAEWHKHVLQASLHLRGFGVISGSTGELVLRRLLRAEAPNSTHADQISTTLKRQLPPK